jgi:hypothetical protein
MHGEKPEKTGNEKTRVIILIFGHQGKLRTVGVRPKEREARERLSTQGFITHSKKVGAFQHHPTLTYMYPDRKYP